MNLLEEAPDTPKPRSIRVYFNASHVKLTCPTSTSPIHTTKQSTAMISSQTSINIPPHFPSHFPCPLSSTMSHHSFTSTAADWSNYYQPNTSSIFADQHFLDSTVVSTTITPPVPNSGQTGSASGSGPSRTVNDSKPTKPARKRSRTSRRTPTTLLETDTSNFRAMVQQYTGGPSGIKFGFGPNPVGTIEHPQPQRITDQARGVGSQFSVQSGYSFQSQQQQQLGYGGGGGAEVEPSRMTGVMTSAVNVKGVGDNNGFMY